MKSIFAFVLVCFVFSAQAQSGFEGTVKVTDSRNTAGLSGDFLVKGNKVVANTPGYKGAVVKSIIDNEKNEIITLSEKNGKKTATKTKRTKHKPMMAGATPQKSAPRTRDLKKMPASVVSINKNGKVDDSKLARQEDYDTRKVTVTKETKKIDGHKCVKVIGNDGFSEITAWVATDLKFTVAELFPSSSGMSLIERMNSKKKGVKGLILEMTNRDLKAGTSYTVKSTVKSQKVKNKEFKIPKGYEIIDYTNLTGKSRRAPNAASFNDIRQRAYDVQKKVREQQAAEAAKEAAPAEEAAPKKEAAPTEEN